MDINTAGMWVKSPAILRLGGVLGSDLSEFLIGSTTIVWPAVATGAGTAATASIPAITTSHAGIYLMATASPTIAITGIAFGNGTITASGVNASASAVAILTAGYNFFAWR